MKKLYPLLTLIILLSCFSSCEKKMDFELRGELENFKSERILVVYDDPEVKLDTIYPKDGKFLYKLIPDTIHLFRLVDEAGRAIPIFADKGDRVTLTGSFEQPEVSGDGANRDYQEFRERIASIQHDSAAVSKAAEDFIRSHPQSFASAYLIDRYFVQVPDPDVERIKGLIDPLSGNIKDCRVLSTVLQTIPQKNEPQLTNVSYFSCKDRSGKYVSWSSKEGYTLINFWASWNELSKIRRDSLAEQVKRLPKDEFRILNLSLDFNEKSWLSACKDDSEQWIEICDNKGWENQIIKQQNIKRLPANILVDRSRKILGTNLYGEALYDKVMQLTQNKD